MVALGLLSPNERALWRKVEEARQARGYQPQNPTHDGERLIEFTLVGRADQPFELSMPEGSAPPDEFPLPDIGPHRGHVEPSWGEDRTAQYRAEALQRIGGGT